MADTVFENHDVIVEFDVRGRDICVFTFTPWCAKPPAAAFARGYHNKIDVDAVFFRAKRNDWWEGPGIAQALDCAKAITGTTSKRLAYGSSMGGFAAIAFAARLGCSDVLAVSPQASIDRAVVPWETRWCEEAARYRFSIGNAGAAVVRGLRLFIAYDQFVEQDRRHVDTICEAGISRGAHLSRLPFAFSGHPTTATLNECGVLGELITTILSGNVDIDTLQRKFRRTRHTSKAVLFSLLTNRRIRERHPVLGAQAAEMMKSHVKQLPSNYEFLMARMLAAAGRYDEALIYVEAAIGDAEDPRPDALALRERIAARLLQVTVRREPQ